MRRIREWPCRPARSFQPTSTKRGVLVALVAGVVVVGVAAAPTARAATIVWKGHTWQVTTGGMAGVCQGDPNNVTIDGNGYLHFKITVASGTCTAAEMFTTDKLGFGTYQWQVDGPIDTYDKNVVLGFFPYGPAAGIGADGTNEIDIEYSRWGQSSGPNGDWTDYPASGSTVGELSYSFSLGGGTLSTSRFSWSRSGITSYLFGGLVAVDGAAGLIKSWQYAPANPTVNIPQQSLPLGMNLWCFNAPPSDGKPVEIVIRDFQFVPEGSSSGSGGSGPGGAGGATRGIGGVGGSAGTTIGGGGGPAGGGAAGGAGAGARAGTGGAATGGAAGSAGARAAAGGEGPSGGRGGQTSTGGMAGAGSGGQGSATATSVRANVGCGCATGDFDASTGTWATILISCAIGARKRSARRRR